jgi:hypothetical protein
LEMTSKKPMLGTCEDNGPNFLTGSIPDSRCNRALCRVVVVLLLFSSSRWTK